ncbi:NSP-interacting kinase 2 [Striga asiatica]|uniref:NSP-interacting kinase 2 n=1 Tax=Striga asiatica TaxID=4170 RepID=A0A5A7P9S4_STRAF|nr:NSP-interacting kinase 2 [Striga asiatica]
MRDRFLLQGRHCRSRYFPLHQGPHPGLLQAASSRWLLGATRAGPLARVLDNVRPMGCRFVSTVERVVTCLLTVSISLAIRTGILPHVLAMEVAEGLVVGVVAEAAKVSVVPSFLSPTELLSLERWSSFVGGGRRGVVVREQRNSLVRGGDGGDRPWVIFLVRVSSSTPWSLAVEGRRKGRWDGGGLGVADGGNSRREGRLWQLAVVLIADGRDSPGIAHGRPYITIISCTLFYLFDVKRVNIDI